MSIRLKNIRKSFGSFKALDNINLEIPDGELVALLGPSGSGKTTLLRIIAGLEFADADPDTHLLFGGEDLAGRPLRERQVGFVFQHYALFRHMTVFENIAFGLRVRPKKTRPSKADINARVSELLKLIQLDGFGHRFPSELSGGQRQRVALARALAIQPQVLLLDEPFGALDARVRQDLRRWLRRLHDEIHVTSVFVTHDQEEALEVADRVVVMNRGKIEQVGTPDEVFHHPETEFVLNFLGNVNLFHGRIEDSGRPVLESGVVAEETIGGTRRLFVRPHELEIEREVGEDTSALPARVVTIQSAGPTVKIELTNRVGEMINVDLSHARYEALRLAKGDDVYVLPRRVKTFEDFGSGI